MNTSEQQSAKSSNPLRLYSRNEIEIKSMDDWRLNRKAVNDGWVPGKSAWETAQAWVGSGEPLMPSDFRALLNSNGLSSVLKVERGVVERKTDLHHRPPAGPRNHDLVLWSHDQTAFIGIESKADDGFSETMSDVMKRATVLSEQRRTLLRDRAEWLIQALMGQRLVSGSESVPERSQEMQEEILRLPYQLFAGVAGTLLEAKKCGAKMAVFAVHQFRTDKTNDVDIAADSKLLDSFASILLSSNLAAGDQESSTATLEWGRLFGPMLIKSRSCGQERWNMPTDVLLFIGKILTDRTLQV